MIKITSYFFAYIVLHECVLQGIQVALQREKCKKLLHVQVQYPVTGTPLSVSSQRTL